MTDGIKKIILIVAGVVVCALVFFLVYQPNADEINQLETQTNKLQNEANRLAGLQAQVASMKEDAEKHESEMDMYFAEYPSRMTEQKAIYNVYKMMVDTGIRIKAIQPNQDMTFMQDGQFSTIGTGVLSDNAESVSGSAAEVSPETKVPINEIVGKYATYQLVFEGKKSEVMKALDWISEHKEHMSIGPITMAFDSETGKLAGTMDVNYYSMNGNGIAYVEPDISGIKLKTDDIFGTADKGEKGSPTYAD